MAKGQNNFEEKREQMVAQHIRNRGIDNKKVLYAMRNVPRHLFLPENKRDQAYMDWPVPIGDGQTISQPYIVAYMVDALELTGGEKVLEIGAGCGYASAVLAEIVDQVFAIERIGKLAIMAQNNLERTGYTNVTVKHDDGAQGWPQEAPFDAILVSAAAKEVPDALKNQLKIGGRLVIPVDATPFAQKLLRLTRRSDNAIDVDELTGVRFVPLVRGATGQ